MANRRGTFTLAVSAALIFSTAQVALASAPCGSAGNGDKCLSHYAPSLQTDFSLHAIEVDGDGFWTPLEYRPKAGKKGGELVPTVHPKACGRTSQAERDSKYLSNRAALACHLERIRASIDERRESLPNGVLIYIHGGMNRPGLRRERVVDRTNQILEDGYYPIFIKWSSGVVSSYRAHLFELRNGAKNPAWAVPTSPIALTSQVAQTAARLPLSFLSQLYALVERYCLQSERFESVPDKPKCDKTDANQKIGSCRGDWAPHVNTPNRCKESDWTLARVGDQVLSTVRVPAKIITTGIVDTIGGDIWDVMLRRVTVMFDGPREARGRTVRTQVLDAEGAALVDVRGPLTSLGNTLAAWQKQSAGDTLPLTLMGHSMGALVGDRLLQGHGDVQFQDIVYMAAASSVDDSFEIGGNYLARW
ncbi:MAG: hypothetical protein ACI8TX_001496 [Hyphomicrobiaceae bacterium]|jgi:hypothetical protein